MIGYITTNEVAAAVLGGVANAMSSRGLPHYWSPGAYPIHQGKHAGKMFIPADDDMLATPLHGRPIQRPTDFPEFEQLVAVLGGLESRQQIDPAALIDPTASDIDS
jgi:hypothetical protein